MIVWLVTLHVVCGTGLLVLSGRPGRWALAVAIVPLLVSLAAIATTVPEVLDGATPTDRFTWVPALDLEFSFRLDGFATLTALLVTAIGSIVLVYSYGYFRHQWGQPRTARFAGLFTLFAGAMLGLVVADDVWTLFVFWELTSVLSFALIGLDDESQRTRECALRALLVTATGGLVMLGGLACLVHTVGSSDLTTVVTTVPDSTMAQIGAALVLIGAFTKSAQFPFHFWLPGAMAAPTPVSAYLHSATMVKAGVIVVARFSPAYAELGWWQPALVIVGGTTMIVGGVAALRRDDAKQSLAFGTVSQLGLLTVLFGLGEPEATAAGVAMLTAHALFKSGLFLTVGAVEHATGSRSLAAVSGVGRRLPSLAAGSGLCALSMIGFVPTLGFVAKEEALGALVDGSGSWTRIALVVVVTGSILTSAYSLRLWWGLFATKGDDEARATVDHAPSRFLTMPVLALGACSLAGGIAAGVFGAQLDAAAQALDAAATVELEPWPGLHLPLLLSLGAIAVGAVIMWMLTPVRSRSDDRGTLGERAFVAGYDGLLTTAKRITQVAQSGSLPMYVAVIFAILAVVLGAGLAMAPELYWSDTVVADSVLQGVVALLASAMAIVVVMARRRFVSVLLLGGVGQGLTVLFLLYGAPDLALTQFMIETLMIVAFLLVLRHFPREYAHPPSWAPRSLRIGLSVLVGVTVAGFALAAGGTDRPTDVTDAIEQLSLPGAGGSNVVNVTIVDFRGMDTMFEITVFGVAALGVANLVAASRRATDRSGNRRLARVGAESLIFDQTIRMIFHITLLVSLYVMLRGHNAPGGGFAGGLIAGAAFVFRLLAGSPTGRRTRFGPSPVTLIGAGMLMAIGSGIGGLLVGNEFLETGIFHVDVPFVGDVKLVTAAIFDAGVYFLVIGVVILVLSNLASRTGGEGVPAT